MVQEIITPEIERAGITVSRPTKQRRSRTRLIRRAIITLALIALVMGLQMYLYYANLAPQIAEANEQYFNLVDERRAWSLSQVVTESINDLKLISSETEWQKKVAQVQNEFQTFLTTPAEGLEVTLNYLATLRDEVKMGDDIFRQLETDLMQLKEWHYDYYGDVVAAATRPGIYLWPTSVLLRWVHGKTIVDTAHFNRALYHIIVGEASAGQATLGELRTRLPDSPLRARVLYTQGRLLYGMGRYEQSIEVVQDSVQMDPAVEMAKRFLDYQLSRGPDEEVEEEDEGLQPGSVSSGGGTLF